MDTESWRPSRPYWHVDAKWVAGLLLFLLLGPTLAVYSLVKVTEEQPAVDALSMTLATAFSRNGLDDETEIASMRENLRASPGQVLRPIPGLRILVREQDLTGLSPRQIRLGFFRQLAELLYRDGSDGLAGLADDPEMRMNLSQGLGPLGLVNAQSHGSLQRLLTPLGVACLVLLVPLIFFSYRFGRLFSPGLVLFAASLPWAAFFGFVALALRNPPQPASTGTSTLEMAGAIDGGALPPLARIVASGYATAALVGLALMVLAVVLQVALRPSRRASPAGRAVAA